jgi:anti-sigma regulatory factor (Ser/Thr protein kinase)
MAKTNDSTKKENDMSCKNIHFPFTVDVSFPGDLEYIPAVRKFIAELLQVSNFDSKFAYRSEIIVDEICNNAVTYGCRTENATIQLRNTIFDNRIEYTIMDQGGSRENLRRLKHAVKSTIEDAEEAVPPGGLGLEIVRMLSERLDVVIDEKNLTSVHVVRKREDDQDDTKTST